MRMTTSLYLTKVCFREFASNVGAVVHANRRKGRFAQMWISEPFNRDADAGLSETCYHIGIPRLRARPRPVHRRRVSISSSVPIIPQVSNKCLTRVRKEFFEVSVHVIQHRDQYDAR
jgi:hypothetical protein